MSGLIDPGVPGDHPRAVLHTHLMAGESITWFTTEASSETLSDYVLALLQVAPDDVRPGPQGYATAAGGSLRLTALRGPRGAALVVAGTDAAGAARVSDALTRESHAMMAAMGRGEPAGNPARARWAPIVRGEVRSDFAGSPVLDVVNGADVVPVVPVVAPVAAQAAAPAHRGVVTLRKGGNVSLTKQVAALEAIAVGLGWDTADSVHVAFDLDASAIMCGESGRVLSDSHFVFFNNLTSPDGTVHHTGDNLTGEGDGDDEVIEVELARMSPQVERIVFAVSIYDADARRQSFGQVTNAFIRLVNRADGQEIARYDLTEDASGETAMIFGEVYRREGEWKFRAVGQGYASGLHGIAVDFGVNV
jgi:tellurium resistance protein TerD